MAANAAEQSGTRAGPRKREAVERLTGMLSRATSAVVTDYRGLTVAQLEELRGQLRTQGVDYVVVKNTLARRAAEFRRDARVQRGAGRACRPGAGVR